MNIITFQNVKDVSSQDSNSIARPLFKLGERARTPDGREWIYVKASAAFSAGHVVVPAAVTSVGTTISSSTDSQGRIVYITKASAGWTVGLYENATILIDGGTGTGQYARVKTNTTDTLELYPDSALTTALSTDSTMKIWTNAYVRKAVITTKIQNAVGVAQIDFAANDCGWVLTRGIGRVIAGEVLTVGGSFVTGDDTAGEVVKGTTAKGEFDEQTLGRCLVANSAADVAALVTVAIT